MEKKEKQDRSSLLTQSGGNRIDRFESLERSSPQTTPTRRERRPFPVRRKEGEKSSDYSWTPYFSSILGWPIDRLLSHFHRSDSIHRLVLSIKCKVQLQLGYIMHESKLSLRVAALSLSVLTVLVFSSVAKQRPYRFGLHLFYFGLAS